jgi:hypothetical protein
MAWLRSITGLENIVASDLPEVAKWADTGFVTVGPVVGGGGALSAAASGAELYVAAAAPDRAGGLLGAFLQLEEDQPRQLRLGWPSWCSTRRTRTSPPSVTLPAGVAPVHLTPVYPVSEVRVARYRTRTTTRTTSSICTSAGSHQGAIPGVVG